MTGCSCGDCSLCCHPYPNKAAKEYAERMAAGMQNMAPNFNPLGAGSQTPEPRACSWGFHSWTVWSNEKPMNVTAIYSGAKFVEMRQERNCLKCNKTESRSSL